MRPTLSYTILLHLPQQRHSQLTCRYDSFSSIARLSLAINLGDGTFPSRSTAPPPALREEEIMSAV